MNSPDFNPKGFRFFIDQEQKVLEKMKKKEELSKKNPESI